MEKTEFGLLSSFSLSSHSDTSGKTTSLTSSACATVFEEVDGTAVLHH